MDTKKRASKKKTAKKKVVGRKIQRKVNFAAGVEEFLDPESGELLNPQHELFAQEWMQTFDQESALLAAKFVKPKNAVAKYNQFHNIMKKPQVQERCRAILKERVTHMTVTENFIILKMLDVYNRAMEERPIKDNEGNVIGSEYKDLRVAMQTLKELGTNLGMFQKKTDDRAPNVVIHMSYGNDQPALPSPTIIHGESKRLQ